MSRAGLTQESKEGVSWARDQLDPIRFGPPDRGRSLRRAEMMPTDRQVCRRRRPRSGSANGRCFTIISSMKAIRHVAPIELAWPITVAAEGPEQHVHVVLGQAFVLIHSDVKTVRRNLRFG